MSTLLLLMLVCGTSPENTERLQTAHAANVRARGVAASATTSVRAENGVFVIQADENIAPNHHPLDLVGRTLSARRLDDERFDITNRPVETRPRGALLATIYRDVGASWHYREATLTGFSFPFGGSRYQKLYLSGFGGIYFAPPPEPPGGQLADATSLLAANAPLIAPVLMSKSYVWGSTEIHFSQEADRVVVTWRFRAPSATGALPTRLSAETQAVLHANGDIDLSYPSFVRFPGGVAMITTGNESFRRQPQSLITRTDPAGDAVVRGTTSSDFYDVREVQVSRLGNTDLLEVRVSVGRDLDPAQMPFDPNASSHRVIYLSLTFGSTYVSGDLGRAGTWVRYGNEAPINGALSYSGPSIRFVVPQSYLPASAFDLSVSLYDSTMFVRDELKATGLTIPAAPYALDADLSATTAVVTAPLVETFTVPMLDVFAVWDALEAQGLSASGIEAVAIYTTFPTDIDYFAAAYSTVGNAQVRGIGGPHNSATPRSPALLHLNMAGHNGGILHELGHRWLFFVQLMENGQKRNFNGHDSSHPPATLETTAAFTDGDSPMGGQRFFAEPDGTVTVRCAGKTGFSWLELYLMGLAAPEEVPPFIEMATANALGCPVVMPGPKKMIAVQQVIDAMGPRIPSLAASPKDFPMAYVLVEAPSHPWPEAAGIVRESAQQLMRDFFDATGGRGIAPMVPTSDVESRRRRPTRR